MAQSTFSTMIVSDRGPSPLRPTYEDALSYLNSLQTDHATLEKRRKDPPKDLRVNDALDEMIQCVHDIGYKPSDFDRLNALHVAGTKGKGSTCAFINSILAQYHERYGSPKKIGMYTSPHLLAVCERIRINSVPISTTDFTKYFFEVWDALAEGARKRGADPRCKPAYFRYLTLLSFHVFMRENVDVAIYEVGVGGQFDSTNVLVRPTATGITSLGVDHVQVLGNSIEEIAWHKAGIMKNKSPAYTVWQPEGALAVLKQRAAERETTLTEVPIGKCLHSVPIKPDEDFQKRNASLAVVLAAEALARLTTSKWNAGELPQALASSTTIDVHALVDNPLPQLFQTGLTNAVWRGRGETIEKGYAKWLIDGAHTDDSLQIVSDWLGRTVQQARAEQGEEPLCILIFNQQASTRNARKLIETVQHRLSRQWNAHIEAAIFCANVTYENQNYKADFLDRNTDPTEIHTLAIQHEYARIWQQYDPKASTHIVPSIEEAVGTARDLCHAAKPGRPAYILATGSFRLVGGVLTILEGEAIATESITKAQGVLPRS